MSLRRLLFIVPVILLIGLAVVAGSYLTGGKDPRELPSALINKPAPTFDLPAVKVEGQSTRPGLSSNQFAGKVTLVNFFASWCTPCLAEHPHITALSRMKGLSVVGINYKNKPEEAVRWLARHGNPYARIGADVKGDIALEFGLYGVPETFLIDQKGRIRLKHVGPITAQVMNNKIMPAVRALLAQ